MRVLLALDYSTSATGWAKFDLDTLELLSFGVIEPDFKNPVVKKIPTFSYPVYQVLKLRRLAEQVILLMDEDVCEIVIEEINGGSRSSRISQKILDGGHFTLLSAMPHVMLQKVRYVDSDGRDGWRSHNGLGLQLSAYDKLQNKERKKLNKKIGKGQKKLPLITQKTLAAKYANKQFNLELNVDLKATDGDKADALGLGWFYLTKILATRAA